MPNFVVNRPAPAYSAHMKRFLMTIARTHPYNEDRLWLNLFRELATSFDGQRRLMAGEFAEFVPMVDRDVLESVIKLYDEALVGLRGQDTSPQRMDPAKASTTNEEAKRVVVARKTIKALETVWDMYYGTPYEEKWESGELGLYMPYHSELMAHLLNWTLRLEWSSVNTTKIKNFDAKWQAVKELPGVMSVRIINSFLTSSGYNRTQIKHDMPTPMKMQLYGEALAHYNARHDADYDPLLTHRHRDCPQFLLARQVIVEEKEFFDNKFKSIFQPYYNAVPLAPKEIPLITVVG
jgi:hypothetical protein